MRTVFFVFVGADEASSTVQPLFHFFDVETRGNMAEPIPESCSPSSSLSSRLTLLSAGGKLVGGAAAAGWFWTTSEARKGFPDMFED